MHIINTTSVYLRQSDYTTFGYIHVASGEVSGMLLKQNGDVKEEDDGDETSFV